jgi:hypothetical protein
MEIVIVCHVEFGYATNTVVFDRTTRTGAVDGVKNTIRLADSFGAKVSFMIMPEVLQAIKGIEFGDHEVGLHIHPDDTFLKSKGLGGLENLRDYGLQQQKDIISSGREIIQDVLGVSVKTFVAGRWSVNNETIKALVELGFTHDGSAIPDSISNFYDWTKLPRISMPYRPSERNYQLKGDTELVIVPVSKMIRGGIVSPENRMGLGFLKAAFKEYALLGMPVFHIAFHSPAMTSRHYQTVFNELLKHMSGRHQVFSPLHETTATKGDIVAISSLILPYLENLDASVLFYILSHSISRSCRSLRPRVSNEQPRSSTHHCNRLL